MRRVLRLGAAALLVGGIVAAWHWRHLFEPLVLARMLGATPWAPLVFVALHIAASLFFVPRTVLALGAGLIFGLWWGTLWAALGSVAGAIAGFLAARYIHGGLAARLAPDRIAALSARVERGGWRAVAVVRLVPVVPHSLANYALGLTRIRLGAYAIGSLLGQLPLTIAYVDFGAAGGQALFGTPDWPHRVLWPSLIGAAALALSLLIPAVARRRMRPTATVQEG
ncbi:MAG TPA: VTT domain-containing protein [Stellaceae bacterium]|nr:VTT domain-containing protein [Stellaceae bacterium]